jgi:hypothetical protein
MNANLTNQTALINLSARNLNADVAEAYGQRSDETGQRLMELLTVRPEQDNAINVLLKMMNFYFGCNRVPSESLAADSFDQTGRALRTNDVIVGEVRLKLDKKLINGSPTGYYRVNIPHFLPDKIDEIRGYHHEFGSITVLYTFSDKRQIKVFVSNEAEGFRVINHLLKAVNPKFLLGTAEQHAYVAHAPKTRKPHRLTGMTGKANRLRVRNPDKTSVSYQL